MEDNGIDYPYSIKQIGESGTRFNNAGPVKMKFVPELIVLTDKEYKKARNVLTDFVSGYLAENSDQKRTKGWTKVRELKHQANVFDFTSEKIAPNSVIVATKHLRIGDEEYTNQVFYYVSDKKGSFGEPLIFIFVSGEENKSIPTSHIVSLINVNWTTPENFQEVRENLFACQPPNHPEITKEFEIWKEGKSLTESKTEKSTTGGLTKLQFAPAHNPAEI